MVIWMSVDNFGWHRTVIDETTGESIGACSGAMAYFGVPLYALKFVPTVLTGIMAFKTKRVDDLIYSESKWILTYIIVTVQVSTMPYVLL